MLYNQTMTTQISSSNLFNNSKLISKSHNLNLKSDLNHRSYRFSLSVIGFINLFPSSKVFWVIGDQLLRSSLSIGANIVEAKASASKRDFINYFQISLKSANETVYWLSVLKDSNLTKSKQTSLLIDECQQLCRMLGSSLLTMKGKKF
jgi:four helix bundle protein